MTDVTTQSIPVQMNDGEIINVEASIVGREDVASPAVSKMETVLKSLNAISKTIFETVTTTNATKTTISFGIELSVESGQLTTLIVKGGGKANFQVTLEWQK